MKRPELREDRLDDAASWMDGHPVIEYIDEMKKYADNLERQVAKLEVKLKRAEQLRDGAESQCRRAQTEREQAYRERDAAAREVVRLLAERDTAIQKIADLEHTSSAK